MHQNFLTQQRKPTFQSLNSHELVVNLSSFFRRIYTCKVKKEIRPEDLRSIIEDSVTNPGEGIPVVYGSNCSTPPRSPNV